jgi:hypothetical protein
LAWTSAPFLLANASLTNALCAEYNPGIICSFFEAKNKGKLLEK